MKTVDNTGISTADKGFKIIAGTTKITGKFKGFSVWDRAIIEELDVNGVAATGDNAGIIGVEIPDMALVYVSESDVITGIKLTSGVLYMFKTI